MSVGDLVEALFDAFPFFDNWRFWLCVLAAAGCAVYWENQRPGPADWMVAGPILAVGVFAGLYWSYRARHD